MTGFAMHVGIDDARVRKALAGIEAAASDMSPAMDEIGSMLVASVLRRFETETAPSDKPWKPSRRAREKGGQTLTDTGRLRDSITHRHGSDFVEVGTNVIYSAIHQFGGRAGRGHAATIPARPFIGLDAGDEAEIVEIITDHLRGLQ